MWTKIPKYNIWEWYEPGVDGIWRYSFDGGKTEFYFFRDYPQKLTEKQRKLFAKAYPLLAEIFGRVNDEER